jgi:hypothetical protein
MHLRTNHLTGIHRQGRHAWWRGRIMWGVAVVIVFTTGLSGTAHGQSLLQLLRLETVNYGALPSGGNIDRPSIAVRDDGLVRIAISDYEGTCCPLVVPLKVATRGAMGDWTYLTITNYGDHPVPRFLSSGELGVIYMDYADQLTIKFARVGDTSAQIEAVFQLGLNPGGFVRLAPWAIQNTNDIQAVVLFNLRLRRTATGWSSAALSGMPQDIAIGPAGDVLILTSQGLLTFASSELSDSGILTPVDGGVPSGGNLIVDDMEQIHIAYALGGNAIYGFLQSGTWNLETVATGIGELLNDQSLLVDTSGQPHLIYQNSGGHIIVASKTATGWVEGVDLGPGVHGTMVLGPVGDIHATFTSTSDKLVRYAHLQKGAVTVVIDIQPGSDPASINPKSNGKIPVAILTTDIFDATTVNASTVHFGAAGTEAAPVQVAVEDVNGDGRPDLLLTFNTPATGITCGATSASLTGQTFSG